MEENEQLDDDGWKTDYLSRVMSLGQLSTISVTESQFDRIMEISLRERGRQSKRAHRLVGKLLHHTNEADHGVDALASFLINPFHAGRARTVIGDMSSSQKVLLLRRLLPPGDTTKLTAHLDEMLRFRNAVAHGTWNFYRVGADGDITEGRWLRARAKAKEPEPWNDLEVGDTELRDRTRRARVLGFVLSQSLSLMARAFLEFRGMANEFYVGDASRRVIEHTTGVTERKWFRPLLDEMFPDTPPQAPADGA